MTTILGEFLDEFVIVGGLAPGLLVNQTELQNGVEQHVGTMDLDIGLALTIFDENRYEEIAERLRNHGFKPDHNERGNITSQRWQLNKITIDFLIAPSEEGDKPASVKHFDVDFGALITPGLDLAFIDYDEIYMEGKTTKEEKVRRKIRVCGPGAFVVLKTLALKNRGENKDAYDLYYVIRNYKNGPKDVAERFMALFPNPHCEMALEFLKEDFQAIDSLGIKRTVEFYLGEGSSDDDMAIEIRGFLKVFIDECELRLSKKDFS